MSDRLHVLIVSLTIDRETEMITTQAEFELLEQEWRARLTGRSLVIEADIDPDEAREVFEIIGRSYPWNDTPQRRASFLFEFRATFVAGMCSTAFDYYLGGMWPFVEKALGHRLAQPDQQIFSDAFRKALDSFGLSRFRFPRRNVDEILMHVGIPGQRMDEFIDLLWRRSGMSDGLDGRQFCQWLARLSSSTATLVHGLDVPSYRFLTEGREIAEDLVDRCLELLEDWHHGGASHLEVSTFPRVMQRDLLRSLEELGEKRIASPKARTRQVDVVPRVLFHALEGVHIRLPSLEVIAEETISWTVRSDDLAIRRRVDPPWPGDAVTPETVAVTKAVRDIIVQASPGDRTWELALVDPRDPLLVFDGRTGELVPPRNTLPKTDVWIAAPNPDGRSMTDLIEVEGGSLRDEPVESILGWWNWAFARIDLRDLRRFRFRGSDQWRYVSTVTRPTIEFENMVPNATSAEGGHVFSTLPLVTIPPDLSQPQDAPPTVEWRTTVRDVNTRAAVVESSIWAKAEPQGLDLGAVCAESLAGTFEVDVSGPLGRGVRRRFSVVSGLKLDPDLRFRRMLPNDGGLEPASIQVESASGVTVPPSIMLSRRRALETLEAIDQTGRTVQITVAIPSMSVALAGEGFEAVPSHAPVQVNAEDIGTLRLKVNHGNPDTSPPIVAMHGDSAVQTLIAKGRRHGGASEYNLGELSDTLQQHHSLTLHVSVDGSRIPVARIRPRTLAEAVQLVGSQIVVVGTRTDEPLEVGIYRRYAPWRPASVFTTTDGVVDLGSELLDEGELCVVIRVEDPWVPFRWPTEYPSRGVNVFDVQVRPLVETSDETEAGIRSWLARAAPLHATRDLLPLVMSLYSGNTLDKFRVPGARLREELTDAVRALRRFVPVEMDSGKAFDAPLGLLVASDVVTLPAGQYRSSPSMWDFAPALAYLTSPVDATSESTSAESDARDRALGAAFQDFVVNGDDPEASVGRFNDTTRALSRMPAARVAEIWRVANCVPSALLDTDSRAVAGKELFDHRVEASYDIRGTLRKLELAEQVLERTFGRAALSPIHKRLGADDWTSLPAASIAFALIARAAARGHENATKLHAHTRPSLETIARAAPRIVEQDLVLADIWTERWSRA
ncbi:hypothetical protein [Curtobacterium sp. Leaf261]|uniref:hypothetical protein n=1 Tax=Curtobacterium sp. Leaf261 TaxID=1736311 RepID=UPI0006FC4295|nr:hypothetical protein [Curtobacterium sp. Leaf261]KQO65172.1 hypothetical protein ASF23_03400 [Curtobacterium sp. Leaf261]